MIELEWPRDLDGYRIDVETSVKGAHPRTLFADVPPQERLVRQGGKLATYLPLSKFDRLFVEFCNVHTAKDLEGFANRFGPLTADGNLPRGEPVDFVLEQAAGMRKLIGPLKRAARSEAALMDGPTGFLARTRVSLALDKERRCTLKFSPETLLGGLWLQFGQAVSGGVQLRTCHFSDCGRVFWGRRKGATFCSNEHKRRHFSLMRSREV